MSRAGGPSATLRAVPITRKEYTPYGAVVAADMSLPWRPANMGTARRFNWLGELENLRPKAAANLCVFRCKPYREPPLTIKLLERHAFSTQVFIPMSAEARYLAVVCLGGSRPDLATLKAFVVTGSTGISYRPGVWHHPLITLSRRTDFTCLVFEDKTRRDCEVVALREPVTILRPDAAR